MPSVTDVIGSQGLITKTPPSGAEKELSAVLELQGRGQAPLIVLPALPLVTEMWAPGGFRPP